MDLAAVMDEVGDALDTISGLHVYRYPPDRIEPPAGIVAYPDTITYDETYGRGMDRVTLPVLVVVGRVSDRATKDRLAAYAAGSGSSSVKAVIDGHTFTACDSVRVESVEFDSVSIAGVDYMSALFSVDIAGSGTG